MPTAIIKDFVTNNGLEVEESITLSGKTVTSLVDSSTVNAIVTSPSVASSIVVAGGASTKTYDSADLLPLSGNTSGELAFVNTTNRLYLWNGSGWYGIALINTSPTFDAGGAPASSYTLDSNGGSPTTITLNATDPEGASIQYSYLSSDASSFATISQSNNVFTVTALSDSALDSNGYAFGGTFDVTFRASDGVNIVPAVSSFTITIEVNYDWATSTQQGSRFTTAQTSGAPFFGYSVAMSDDGNSLIVGARAENLQANGNSGSSKGTASIYTRSGTTWSFEQRLVSPSYSSSSEYFGTDVAMSGDGNTVVIGAPGVGYIQIWTKDEDGVWVFQRKILPVDTIYSLTDGSSSYFGQHVDMDRTGNIIVVSAYGKDTSGYSDRGAVFQYKKEGLLYYDVESAISLTSKSISAEDVDGTGFEFNNDGTKMYITGYATDSIYQYSLSTAWDISTATYDNVSLDISATNPYPTCLKFNNDGTKLWVVSPNVLAGTSESIYEYGFTTPYDLSTASYSNVNIDLSSQESRPHGIDFSPDGTKMFMIGWTQDRVFQYDLSTAWDITSVTYSGKSSFQISSTYGQTPQDSTPKGLALNGDGTKIFITGDQNNKIFQYSLSTAYDASTMSYDNVSINSGDSSPFQVGFNNDGSRMYLLGIGSTMRQWKTVFLNYSLENTLYNFFDFAATSFWGSSVAISSDGNTMVVGNQTYATNKGRVYVFKRVGTSTSWTQFGSPILASDGVSNDQFSGGISSAGGVAISGNGKTLVVSATRDDDNSQSDSGSVYIYENTSTTNYDVGNMIYTGKAFDFDLLLSNDRDDAAGFAFNNDGTKLFMGDYHTDAIHQYSLSSPYDVSSAVYDYIGFDVSDRVEYIYGLRFKPDGTSFYIVDYNLDDIFQYNLSTAWDITSASYANTLDVSTNANNPYGFSFKPDGTKLFVVGNASDTIAAYNLSTAWDISSASYASENFSVTSQAPDPQDVIFNSAGTKMYVLCMQNDRIYQYSLSTAWDVSSASYDSENFYLSQYIYGESIGEGRQIEFNSDGTRLWIVDSSQSKIVEFSTTTPTWTETKLTSPNPSGSGYYGQAVAIDDENSVILVGTNKENSNTGRVYVYQRTGATWNSSTVQKKELASLTSDLQSSDEFGFSVAVSRGGADAVVGAIEVNVGSSTQAGAIYIFTAPKT